MKDTVLERIDALVMDTLRKPPLDVNLVIRACDRLTRTGCLTAATGWLAEMYREQLGLLRADAIRERMRRELGDEHDRPRLLTYEPRGAKAMQTLAPLGVLLHITAGNGEGLPFLSLLDGLLTGNINLVKLPQGEGGLTQSLLDELCRIEPSLRDYAYLFDVPSDDLPAMRKLAAVADAIVLWGGDEAVSAVRRLAAPNTKIIEWGHKLSFAYVTKEGMGEDALERLARHICRTNQLFCSSCQGVFLDTEDREEVYAFCTAFLPVLERVCRAYPSALDPMGELFLQGNLTLQDYHRRIAGGDAAVRLFRGAHCSLTAQPDSRLEPSLLFRNLWVKPLKREDIMTLRPYKGYLQTAALLCGEEEHGELAQTLLRAGLVKVSDGLEMSSYAVGEAHDGAFPLRCYTKWVSVQEYR